MTAKDLEVQTEKLQIETSYSLCRLQSAWKIKTLQSKCLKKFQHKFAAIWSLLHLLQKRNLTILNLVSDENFICF